MGEQELTATATRAFVRTRARKRQGDVKAEVLFYCGLCSVLLQYVFKTYSLDFYFCLHAFKKVFLRGPGPFLSLTFELYFLLQLEWDFNLFFLTLLKNCCL